jgi:UDP:flavonoid glycosyltransferase YjiC (YdhE family)
VPIVNALLEQGAIPVLGADGGPLALLRGEFPQLEHVVLPGLEIRYGRGASQAWSMVRQFPAMLRSIRQEEALLAQLIPSLRLDAVISDQRFGVRSDQVPSVLITHQVFPFTPAAQRLMRAINRRHIARFDRCWIMDEEQAPGLAGELSHGHDLPANAHYIGVQSRFKATASTSSGRAHSVVAVVSGPEPQRTLLEEKLLAQLEQLPGRHLLVRGKPGSSSARHRGPVEVVDHLNAADLRTALLGASLIVSRSGYTTLMDLVVLGRSALIVPTPGQAEQEYLARLHRATGRFLVQQQDRLDLSAALGWKPGTTPPRAAGSGLERALQELAALLHR